MGIFGNNSTLQNDNIEENHNVFGASFQEMEDGGDAIFDTLDKILQDKSH